jgi:hypothetical protein
MAPSTFVTPYLIPPGSLKTARTSKVGDVVDVPLALSGMPWSVNRFFVEGSSWEPIPAGLGSYKTLDELCKRLFESDPLRYAYYDSSKKTAAERNDLALLLFDYWGNTGWRWATIEDKFDWSVLKHDAGTIATQRGDNRISHVLLPRPLKGKPIHAAPGPSAPEGVVVPTNVVTENIPAWLTELMGILRDVGKASGWNRSIGLAQANEKYRRVIEDCSKAYYHLQGLRGLVELTLEYSFELDPSALDVPDLETGYNLDRRRELLKRVKSLEASVKDRVATDPDATVKAVAPWLRDARIDYANQVRGILTGQLLTQRLKQLVDEQSKPDSAGEWANDYVEAACIILEHAYCALLQSPYTEEASEHVAAMLDKIGSKPVAAELISAVEDERFDLKATSDPGNSNPLTVLTGLIGTEAGARLEHLLGMAGSIAQLSIVSRFPSVVKDKKLAVSLASRFLKTLITLADSRRKALSVAESRSQALALIQGINRKDGRQLTILQNRFAGISWGRWCKSGLAFLGLYFAVDRLGSSPSQLWQDELRDWLDLGSASLGAINSVNKILGTWGMFAAETGIFVGVAMGGAATLMAMCSSAIDAFNRADVDADRKMDRGDPFGAGLALAGSAAAAAGFAAFIAFEFYGSALGPPGMALATLLGVGSSVVNTIRDATMPGAEKVYRAFVERMRAPDHHFMHNSALQFGVDQLAHADIAGVFMDFDLLPPFAKRDDPSRDFEARLGALGFDKLCVQSMCVKPTYAEVVEDARIHGVKGLPPEPLLQTIE